MLWALALIALLVTRVLASGRAELSLAANLSSAETAQAIADGTVYEAIFRVMARQWAADGELRRLRTGAEAAELQIVDLGGRINPNEVSRPVMQRLLVEVGATPAQADVVEAAMEDWRTPGEEIRTARRQATRLSRRASKLCADGSAIPQSSGVRTRARDDAEAAGRTHSAYFAICAANSRSGACRPTCGRGACRRGSSIGCSPSQAALSEPKVVEITVTAYVRSGARSSRQAVIGLFPPGRGNPNPWRILSWE